MLVLSRKQNQSVLFPTLGIRVDILRVAGKTVSVGIDAPREIQILRNELPTEAKATANASSTMATDGRTARAQEVHALRNRLNKASLAMRLLQRQLDAGRIEEAEESLALALQTFDLMEKNIVSQGAVPEIADLGLDAASGGSRRKRALLVEDDPNERMLLASYLRASGFEVDTAEDGQAALEYLANNKPDAVVMDMEMPRLNGIKCVEQIRNDEQFDELKLFVVSGMDQAAAKLPVGDRGVQGWFQKPLRPEELVHELSSSLN